METQWLRTFVAAARAESFRRAAVKLFINQTTVSHHIARLEEYVGTALFEPSGRGVRLTQAGQRYLAYADDLLVMESKARDAVNAAYPAIRLAASPSLAETLLPWIWRQLYRYDERLQIDVCVYPSHRMRDAFQEKSCDAAFSRLPAGGTLDSRLLFHDPIGLVAPADMDAWDVASLLAARVIVQPDASYSRELLQRLRALIFTHKYSGDLAPNIRIILIKAHAFSSDKKVSSRGRVAKDLRIFRRICSVWSRVLGLTVQLNRGHSENWGAPILGTRG
jgi:DNA-binding transcriptional LysR family regulator